MEKIFLIFFILFFTQGYGFCYLRCPGQFETCVASETPCRAIPADVCQLNSTVCSGNGRCTYTGEVDAPCNGDCPTTCKCSPGWFGDSCQFPISTCFGKNSTESSVCSGNGICTSTNTCTCANGYIGEQCEVPLCFGIPGNQTDTCGGQGTCNKTDTCICNQGRSGPQCGGFICNGKNSSDPTVCSGNGVCQGVEDCKCADGRFTGIDCQLPLCFMVNSTDPTVCEGRGICTGPDICQCNNSTGSRCEITLCFGKGSDDNNVCSKSGTCIGFNQCRCNTGFTGENCQNALPISCYGFSKSNPMVCSGNGVCDSNDTCTCNGGYSGPNCDIYSCNDVLYNETNVCGGKGICIAPSNCICQEGYQGSDCTLPLCSNKCGEDQRRGACAGPNQCLCEPKITGSMCEKNTCYGVHADDRNVCSGKGKCEGLDKCNCQNGYTGEKCQTFGCTKVGNCNGNGLCVGPEKCQCYSSDFLGYYGGTDCKSCALGYTGTGCIRKVCPGIEACNNRGTCQNDRCVCNVNYNGTLCDVCANDYVIVGGECTLCTASNCTSNGQCTAEGKCNCNVGFSGEKCSSCDTNYYGAKCDTFFDPASFTFSGSFERLVGTMFFPQPMSNISCNRLFSPESVSLLGESPICYISNQQLNVIFGLRAMINQTSTLDINIGLFEGTINYKNIAPVAKLNKGLVPLIVGPFNIGSCDDLILDGSLSYESSGKGLKYSWTIINRDIFPPLRDYLLTLNSSRIVIPSTLIPIGLTDYTLKVFDFTGTEASTFITVRKYNKIIPVITVFVGKSENDPALVASHQSPLKVIAEVTSCGNITYQSTWRQVRTLPNVPFTQSGNSITINSFPGYEAKFQFVLTVLSNGEEFSDYFFVKTVFLELVPIISGGNRIISSSNPIVLNASQSYDLSNSPGAETFQWDCENNLKSPCFILPLYGKVVSVSLPVGNYTITLTYSKGQRSKIITTKVDVLSTKFPTVGILLSQSPSKLNNREQIIFSADVSGLSAPNIPVFYEWRIRSSTNTSFRLTTDITTTSSITSQELRIKPYIFEHLVQYTVQLFVREVQNSVLFGYSEIPLFLDPPPYFLDASVSSLEGTSLLTDFTVTAYGMSDWNKSPSDRALVRSVQYRIGYIDPTTKGEVILDTSQTPFFKTKLPTGSPLSFFIDLLGDYKSIARLTRNINVKGMTFTNEAQKVEFLTNQISQLTNFTTENSIVFVSTLGSLNNNTCSGSCNFTSTELSQRAELRDSILTKIFSTVQTVKSSSEQELTTFANLLLSTTSVRTELKPSTVDKSIDFFNTLLKIEPKSLATGRLDPVFVDVLSTFVEINTQSTNNATAFSRIESSSQEFLNKISLYKPVGEAPTESIKPGFIFSTQKQDRANLQKGMSVQLTQIQNGKPTTQPARFILPSSILESLGNNEVNLNMINYGNSNPFVSYSNGSQSSLVSLSLFSTNGTSLDISNLKTPITIQVPGSYSLCNYTNVICNSSYACLGSQCLSNQLCNYTNVYCQLQCRFWNPISLNFSSEGCKTTNITQDLLTCQCDHLTTFAAFVQTIPKVDLNQGSNPLTPKPVEIYLNPVPASLVGGITGLYILFMIVSLIIYYTYEMHQPKPEYIKDPSKGLLFYIKNSIVMNHPYLSLIFQNNLSSNLTRNKKITLIYLEILVVLATNALAFETMRDKSSEFVLSSLFSSLISVPVTLFFVFIFKRIRVYYPASSDDYELLEMKELEELENEAPKEVQETKTVEGAFTNYLDEKLQGLFDMYQTNVPNGFKKVIGIVSLISMLALYVPISFAIWSIFQFAFKSYWKPFMNVLFFGIMLILPLFYLKSSYFDYQVKKYTKTGEWKVHLSLIIILGIFGFISMFISLLLLTLGTGAKLFLNSYGETISAVVLLMFLFLFTSSWIVFTLKPKKNNDNFKWDFPHYISYPIYSFIYLMCIGLCVSIHFNAQFAWNQIIYWLICSLITVGSNNIIILPILLFIRSIYVYLILPNIKSIYE